MKRAFLAAALIAATPIPALACTERQIERLAIRAEALFQQMNATDSPDAGRAFMQTEEAIHACSQAQAAGNTTPLSEEAFASAAERYPHGYFPNPPPVYSKWHDPEFGAMVEDCQTAKAEDPTFECKVSTKRSSRD